MTHETHYRQVDNLIETAKRENRLGNREGASRLVGLANEILLNHFINLKKATLYLASTANRLRQEGRHKEARYMRKQTARLCKMLPEYLQQFKKLDSLQGMLKNYD